MGCRKIVLIGGGGHCMSVLDSLLNGGCCPYDDIVIVDRPENIGKDVLGIKICASDHQLKELFAQGYRYAFITLGCIQTTARRRYLWNMARECGFQLINIIDQSAVVSSSSSLGSGVFVGKSAIINAGAVIGDMAIINTRSVIEHGCSIGDFSHISVGSVLCGGVSVEHDSFIGANAAILQEERIKEYSVIPAGAVVKHSRIYLPQRFI